MKYDNMEIKSNYIPHNFRNKYLKNVGGSYSSTVLQPTVSGEAGTKVVVIDDLETSSKDCKSAFQRAKRRISFYSRCVK